MSDDTTSSGHSRARLAAQVRRCQPDRLVDWQGWEVQGAFVNPYVGYGDARYAKQPREVLICELLVGDLFTDALLHPSCRVSPKRAPPARPQSAAGPRGGQSEA